jgi:hypothetical protein
MKQQNKHIAGAAALFLSGYNDTVTRDFNVSMRKKDNTEYFDLQAKSNKANRSSADTAAQAPAGNGMDVDSGPGDVEPAAPAFLAGAGNAAQRISSIIKLLVATRYNIFS